MTTVDDGRKHPAGRGNWSVRRRFMFIVSLFCAYCITYVMLKGQDSRVNETIVTWAFLCLGAIVGSYVFGAAWQDINFKKIDHKEE